MSEYQPLSTRAELDLLDIEECTAGYMAGLDDLPEPGSDKSKSYWHGWRNGMMDKGRLPRDEAADQLVGEYGRSIRAH